MQIESEDDVILNTIANCVDKVTTLGPFRKEDAKSTFYVSPELHRKLDIVCGYTGQSRQEIYSKSLRYYLNGKYLDDIDVNRFKAELL